ncbi:MAG: hypothetical protein LBP33_02705 [Candidatus Adiutrix sp.]|jgi:hypothetical protein|nr:hypothetical protein [Candidatus Adiutrix sp.]
MSINNLLFSISNRSPAMLSVGVGQTQNYNNLADLSSSLFSDSSSDGGSLFSTSSAGDTVSLTYKSIGDKIVSDLAGLTAGTIREYPELDGEYVIAIVDDGLSREARVYRRSDILDNFEGSEEEKAALKKELDSNPLMVFSNAGALPETSPDAASQQLAKNVNEFLKINSKTMNTLTKAGYDPLADMPGSDTLKKYLANFARAPLTEDEV